MLSLIIPIFKNEKNIPALLDAVRYIKSSSKLPFEIVYVVDGSPDLSYKLLQEEIKSLDYPAQLLAHSRNFGSFAAIRAGLKYARGSYFAVMAADLQEPPELILKFSEYLRLDQCDVVVGVRDSRADPFFSRLMSKLFWSLYRRYIVRGIPEGGVDVFGCNLVFRNQLVALNESRTSLIALIFWLGFRKEFISYERRSRVSGKSAWTWKMKWEYMLDSIFSFTDYPISLLVRFGIFGVLISLSLGLLILIGRIMGWIEVSGYAPIMLSILFFGALNLLGIGLVGIYAWRGYENSKQRPSSVIAQHLIRN